MSVNLLRMSIDSVSSDMCIQPAVCSPRTADADINPTHALTYDPQSALGPPRLSDQPGKSP